MMPSSARLGIRGFAGRTIAVVTSAALAAGLISVAAPGATSAAPNVTPMVTPTPAAAHTHAPKPRLATAGAVFSISGRVTNTSGPGVAGILVTAIGDNASLGGSATTGSDGTYAVGNLPAGYYSLRFSDPGGTYPTVYWSTASWAAEYESSRAFPVTANVDGKNVQLPDGLFISGTLGDGAGGPKGGLTVVASTFTAAAPAATATSAPDGTYRLGPLVSDSYLLAFSRDGGGSVFGYWSSTGFTTDRDSASLATLSANRTINAVIPASHSIRGTVLKSDGSAASGVSVFLANAADDGGSLSAVTGPAGQFEFAGLYQGTYGVMVTQETCAGLAYAGTRYYGSTGLVEALSDAAGLSVTGADVTGVTIHCPAEPTLTISGRVTGPTGLPLANVAVGTAYGSTTTAANGTWTLSNLMPGSYEIDFYDQSEANSPAWYSSSGPVGSSDLATPIVLTTASRSGIDVQLRAAPTISGRVTGPSGAGLPGIAVVLGSGPLCVMGPGTGKATTGADGSFVMHGLFPDAFNTVFFYDPAGTYMPGFYSTSGFQAAKSHASPVSVRGGSVGNVDVQLPAARTISGKLTGPTGLPLAGYDVVALSATTGDLYTYGGGTCGPPRTTATTTATGAFVIHGLWPDVFGLVVSKEVTFGYYAGNALVQNPHNATLIDVTSASATVNPKVGSGYGPLYGWVTGEEGHPLGTSLAVEAQSTDGYVTVFGSVDADTGYYEISNVPNGSYRIGVVAWEDTLRHGTGWWTGSGLDANPAGATTVALGADNPMDFELPVGAYIRGRILRSDGLPIAGAGMASASGAPGEGLMTYKTSGRGEYAASVGPGSYYVSVQALGFATGYYSAGGFKWTVGGASKVTVGTSDVRRIGALLPPELFISGRISRSGGAAGYSAIFFVPAGQAFDPADPSAGQHLQSTYADQDGMYRYLFRASGTYQLWVGCYPTPNCGTEALQSGWYRSGANGNFQTGRTNATVLALGTAGVGGIDITLPAARTIAGRVTSATGVPVPWVWVEAVDPASGKLLGAGATAADGSYVIAGLNSTSYAVRMRDATGSNATAYYDGTSSVPTLTSAKPVDVTSASATGVNIKLAGGVVRYYGPSRFATAADISRKTFTDPSAVDAVYIANATSFPDALAGAAAAGTVHGPVLLANATGALDPATIAELNRLGKKKIIVLGGTGSISAAVYSALTPYGSSITRYSGSSRFATAADVSRKTFTTAPMAQVIYIANAYNFPDALAGAAAAGTVPGPVLLAAPTGALDPATIAELNRLGKKKIIVLGGTGSISAAVYSALTPYGSSITRYSGSSRFATAADVSRKTFTDIPAVDAVYVANAYNFPDALAGAAAAGTVHGPVLLAAATGALDPATVGELQRIHPKTIVVLGGTGSISDAVLNALKAYLN